MEKNNKARQGGRSFWEAFGAVMKKTGYVLSEIWKWIYRLRSIFMAIPVAVVAVKLAKANMERLPEMVGINLLETGEYGQMIARDVAVMGPLAVTALCLLLMFCSRRILYPWLISVFSLILPLFIWVTNVFPV